MLHRVESVYMNPIRSTNMTILATFFLVTVVAGLCIELAT
jgi:hypothetical protein